VTNPYLSRGPVRDPDMLFGRTHELQEIAAFVAASQSVSIVGPRKIGKTSLIYSLMRPSSWADLRLDADNLFVYLDCEVLGEGAHAEILGQFAAETIAALEERGLAPEPALEAAAARPTRLTFEAAVRKLNQRGLRVTLILDEFERLSTNSQLDVNFFNALRSIAGRYQFVFLTASARPLIELTYSGRSQEILSSPFFNIFAPIFLGLLAKDDAYQLMREPIRKVGTAFAPATEDYLYDLVGGHPLGLHVACFHAFDVQDDHAEIERRTLRELEAHFAYTWHNLTPAEQDTLYSIDDTRARASGDTAERGLLRDLVQKSLLVAEGGAAEISLQYRYPSRAWAQFVAVQRETPDPLKTAMAAELTSPGHARDRSTPAGTAEGRRTLVGARLGPYEVLEPLGQGGMAEVYHGVHTRLGRAVAIKVLPAGLAGHADFRERFEREARAVAALRHANIVQVYDFGDAEGMYYMVMEYIAGSDLAQLLAEHASLPLAQVRPLLRDVAAALDYAHAQGLVHRDVKPSNVMIQAANAAGVGQRAILTDFGIAKILAGGSAATKTGVMIGTPDYMAPEQIRAAGEVDARTDIYALGVMLFQMLTGRLPFTGENPGIVVLAHLHQPAPDPRALLPDLPAHIAQAILRALAKDPAERHQTAGALAAELDAE
jgi:eukaryotic-like serine/threonine-protein kinase